jgi:hypothetical protein
MVQVKLDLHNNLPGHLYLFLWKIVLHFSDFPCRSLKLFDKKGDRGTFLLTPRWGERAEQREKASLEREVGRPVKQKSRPLGERLEAFTESV